MSFRSSPTPQRKHNLEDVTHCSSHMTSQWHPEQPHVYTLGFTFWGKCWIITLSHKHTHTHSSSAGWGWWWWWWWWRLRMWALIYSATWILLLVLQQAVGQSVSRLVWLAGWSVNHAAGGETDSRSMLSVAVAFSWGGSLSPWWRRADALSWCPRRNIQEALGSERTCWLMGSWSLWRRPAGGQQPIRFTHSWHHQTLRPETTRGDRSRSSSQSESS